MYMQNIVTLYSILCTYGKCTCCTAFYVHVEYRYTVQYIMYMWNIGILYSILCTVRGIYVSCTAYYVYMWIIGILYNIYVMYVEYRYAVHAF